MGIDINRLTDEPRAESGAPTAEHELASSPSLTASKLLKRAFDLLASLVGLVLLSPLMFLIAVRIKLDSRGPVLYRGPRVGKDGRLFGMYKFRTMRDVPVDVGPRITAQDDPRITRLGRMLRHTKLNELPQLINVLKGDMSLVGPRPEDPQYVALYTPEQRKVLSIRPGITSIASIVYHDEESLLSQETLDDVYVNVIMPHKLDLDLEYLAYRSFLVDLDILWRTARVISPRLVQATPEIEELLYGPVQRFIQRRLSWFTLDWILGLVSVLLANLIWGRTDTSSNTSWLTRVASVVIASFVFALVNQVYGLQHSLWTFASAQETVDIFVATILSTLLLIGGSFALDLPVARTVLVGAFAFALFVAARYRRRLVRGALDKVRSLRDETPSADRKRVLIVGTAGVGRFLAIELQGRRQIRQYKLVGFVNDNLAMRGMSIRGGRVLGGYRAIPSLVAEHGVDLLVVALDKTDEGRREVIAEICHSTPAQVKVIPDPLQLIEESSELRPARQAALERTYTETAVPSLAQETQERIWTGS